MRRRRILSGYHRRMDAGILVSKMRRLQVWLEPAVASPTWSRHRFDRPPYGFADVTVDVTSTSPAASFNCNRICLSGTEGGLTLEGFIEMLKLFDAQRVNRSFVWLSPGPGIDRVREWLARLAFVKVPWTRYPTLVHGGEPVPLTQGSITVREVGRREIASAGSGLTDVMMSGFAESAGREGFHHYMAFEGERPIAVAALAIFEGMGYLTHAATEEAFRRRGAQSALIAHRVAQARASGCEYVVSQTLTMLTDSFANLKRAGFREVYEQEVFERVRM